MSEQKQGEILYLGHASLRITTPEGKVIYVDPYAGTGYDVPADLILVTHQHFDHNQIELPAKKEDTVILQNTDFQNLPSRTAKAAGIRIEAVEAYNSHHPKGEGFGYLLDIDGKVIYVPGDTARTEQMEFLKEKGIDIAFLPIDGFYTMTPEEAEMCAGLIDAKTVIPYHTKVGELFDKAQAAKLDVPGKRILEPGQTISF